jgi:hypothetical protein
LPNFEISNNFKKNIDEKYFKTTKNPYENPYQPLDFKISRKKSANQKSRDFCQIFLISKKKIHRLEYGLKNL